MVKLQKEAAKAEVILKERHEREFKEAYRGARMKKRNALGDKVVPENFDKTV